ncbi:MAG TPA: undecaprenyl-diphosphate phosphatase [Ferruginibacter sp.]|jgi:undecaprenyl-diphosphatase|nr:undecaprenyl-diphosphate phosphatase [Ferruginibacter sp.]
MNTLQSIILSIIEGLTEFLPVSSTGHMIIASSVMGIERDEFVKLFEIAIQLGAILAVVVLYWKKFFDFAKWEFYLKLLVAVIPALVLGKLFADKIDMLLESPTVVAVSLLLGGIILLFVDKMFNHPTVTQEDNVSYKKGFIIGICQCLAMIPGVSRSAASIVGGMSQKLTRKVAAEFSFFLAVPTMVAATGYKLLKTYKTNPEILKDKHNLLFLVEGNIIAFIVAMLAIKFFITYLQKHGFKIFGIYRIILGIIVLVLISRGIIN